MEAERKSRVGVPRKCERRFKRQDQKTGWSIVGRIWKRKGQSWSKNRRKEHRKGCLYVRGGSHEMSFSSTQEGKR